VVVVLGIVVLVGQGGDSSGSKETASSGAPPSGSPPEMVAEYEELAKERVHTAVIAMETFATEHGGTYVGATPMELQRIEPTLQTNLELQEVGSDYYTVLVPSEIAEGAVFSAKKEAGGELIFECSPPGQGGCPPSGDWE
jgi:hypothetical protein